MVHWSEGKQDRLHIKNRRDCKGVRGRQGLDWEFGTGRCNLLYMGWINKFLQYSTGNNIQYPVTNNNGKFENIYMYIYKNLKYTYMYN